MEKLYQNYIFKNHIIAGVLFALALFLLYVLKETLVVIFISYIMVAALLPIVGYLVKKGVPNTIAVIVVFFATLIIFAGLIAPLVPFFASQIQQLFKGFPFYLNKAAMAMGLELSIKEVTQIINPQQLGQNAFALAGGVFGTFLAIITSVAISFYLLLDYRPGKHKARRVATRASPAFHLNWNLNMDCFDSYWNAICTTPCGFGRTI